MHPRLLFGVVLCLSASFLVHAQARKTHDWLTWGGDPERSGWNRDETSLSRTTVRNLELKWKAQIDKQVPIEIESFVDLDVDVRQSIERVRHSAFVPHRDAVRGFVYDVDTHRLREVEA